jgi:hypothetical protein
MSDRLAELVRQRALMQEHLAWLNREIEQASKTAAASPSGAIEPRAPAAAVNSPGSSIMTGAPDAEEILAQYRLPPAAVKENVRKGCFLYFAAALVLLVLGVAIFYFALDPR